MKLFFYVAGTLHLPLNPLKMGESRVPETEASFIRMGCPALSELCISSEALGHRVIPLALHVVNI